MKIETRFDIQQDVLILHENTIQRGTIESIIITYHTEAAAATPCPLVLSGPVNEAVVHYLVLVAKNARGPAELVRRHETQVWSSRADMLAALDADAGDL